MKTDLLLCGWSYRDRGEDFWFEPTTHFFFMSEVESVDFTAQPFATVNVRTPDRRLLKLHVGGWVERRLRENQTR